MSTMMTKGKFIVIEGGDGAGKDTQIDLLKKDFPETSGFVYRRDPGGTALGMKLREVTQYGERVAKQTELLLFLASRAQLVQELILPSLREGKNVICNRFDLSTYAYQIYGRQRLDIREDILTMSRFARGEAIPDLVILLDVPPMIGHERSIARGEKLTRFEQEELAFHERVRQGYLESAKEYPHVVIIDAARPIEEVYKEVQAAVADMLNT